MSTKGEIFIPSGRFAGKKLGYIFQNGDRGVGYYADSVQRAKVRFASVDFDFNHIVCNIYGKICLIQIDEDTAVEKKRKFKELEEDEAGSGKYLCTILILVCDLR